MEDVARDVYFEDVRLQMDAKLWGEEYNRHNPPKKVCSNLFCWLIIKVPYSNPKGKVVDSSMPLDQNRWNRIHANSFLWFMVSVCLYTVDQCSVCMDQVYQQTACNWQLVELF